MAAVKLYRATWDQMAIVTCSLQWTTAHSLPICPRISRIISGLFILKSKHVAWLLLKLLKGNYTVNELVNFQKATRAEARALSRSNFRNARTSTQLYDSTLPFCHWL